MHFCTDCQYETKKSENFFRDLLSLRRQFNGLGHPGKIAHHGLGLHIAVIHAKGHKIKVLVIEQLADILGSAAQSVIGGHANDHRGVIAQVALGSHRNRRVRNARCQLCQRVAGACPK